MKRLKIRDFRVGDVKEILRIHQANEEFFEELPVTEEFILNINRRDDFKFMVAELEGEVIGFLGVLFHSGVGRAEVGPIGIKTEYQQRKVGKKLLEEGLKFLRKLQVKRVTSRVKKENERGIKFFESAGFSPEGYFKDYTQKKEDVVQLVKFL